MASADDLLRNGDLDGARAALVAVVRAEPSNEQARMFLFQLFAVLGEWEKARGQLAALAQLSGEAQMLSVAYGQAINAEAERTKVLAGQARAHQHVASDWAGALVDAIEHFGNGRIAEGHAARETAFDAVPDIAGNFDGEDFEWIANADSRFGPSFEAIVAGRYGIQPFDQVEKITSKGPADLRDIIWYPVQIAFKTGLSVAALLPVRYPGTETNGSPQEKLARATSWVDRDWGQAGSGTQLWSLSTDTDRDLPSLRTLTFV